MDIKILKVDWDNEELVTSISKLLNDSFETINSPLFSNQFLKWKHNDNPFGKSISYVAIDEFSELIGFRSFLSWRFVDKNRSYDAYQPVDTATSPKARGKGVFSLLTKEALNKVDGKLVFNRPNKNSFPGYIKMGWKHVGYIRFGIIPRIMLSSKYQYSGDFVDKNTFIRSENIKCNKIELRTDRTIDYLIWRYVSIPNIKYKIFNIDDGISIIYKINRRNKFKELVICDFIGDANSIRNKFDFIYKIQVLLINEGCHYAVVCFKDIHDDFTSLFIKVPFKKMNLVSKSDYQFIFSLGDVEVF
ncbi:GNAT family N-acetyltransferase [Aliivibrio fischeri]|uniref:GNAT family N-acetyltransferase n=1 Tax=Aliivibrio fischeri TaxID=668 RepID=UPI000A7692C9|nr:GNAT family N-acetyltransferase [Aliivibrio fischeri]